MVTVVMRALFLEPQAWEGTGPLTQHLLCMASTHDTNQLLRAMTAGEGVGSWVPCWGRLEEGTGPLGEEEG